MRLQSPPLVLLSRFMVPRTRKLLAKAISRRLICLLIALSLPIWPGGLIFPRAHAEAYTTVGFAGAPLGYLPLVLRSILWLMRTAPPQDTMESRAGAVARLIISPIKRVAYLDQTITFSAIPTDSLSRT